MSNKSDHSEDKKQETKITNEDDVVVDKAEFKWSELYKKEDWWAIWLGAIVLIIGLLIFLPNPPKDLEQRLSEYNAIMEQEAKTAPFKTVAWHQANMEKKALKAKNEPLAKKISSYLSTPKEWEDNPITAFYMSEEQAKTKREAALQKYEEAKQNTQKLLTLAKEAEAKARAADFKNETLNQKAEEAIGKWKEAVEKEAKLKSAATVEPYNIIGSLIVLGIVFGLFFSIGTYFMGRSVLQFLKGFAFVFLLAAIAFFIAAQADIDAMGIGYVAWALVLGLLISNTIGTPKWVMPAVQTEYYIKTGLVILGASILIGKILLIGKAGIFVTWVVTPIVLIVTYWFGQRILKIPSKTLNITISADMSVSGISAAIATAAACRAKKEELTLAVGMSIIFTSIMMILLPMFIKAIGMCHVWGGAWIGGTIDSTGAVVAAGAFLGDIAMYVAATIKMIQNVIIGAIAFGVAWYWTTRVERIPGQRVTYKEIWYRFPKFVLGFIGASIVFSVIYEILGHDVARVMIDEGVIGGFSNDIRNWFFCLAFVSIGLASNFRELTKHLKGGKPVILYVCGQSFNLLLTLTVAFIMFYIVFPDVTKQLLAM